MPDVTISDALQEAYASAPSDNLPIHTLSFYYQGMVDEANNPMELYIFRGTKGDRMTDEGAPLKDFMLEDTAQFRGGQITEFIGIAFDIKPPDVSTQPVAKGQLLLDGVGREVADLLMLAVDEGVGIEVTYRPYLESSVLIGPQQLPPIFFALSNVVISGLQVTADIVVPIKGNRLFPGELYDINRFPTLVN